MSYTHLNQTKHNLLQFGYLLMQQSSLSEQSIMHSILGKQ